MRAIYTFNGVFTGICALTLDINEDRFSILILALGCGIWFALRERA